MAVEAYFGAETAWVSEIDKHACKVIDARINKPNIGNLKIVNWAEVEPVDIITAGYPCQPFSTAGKRKGVQDERHLWPYIKEAISTIRPSFVFLENVRGHFGLGFRDVLTDLASIGYDVRWSLIRASDVGAPHRRERLFIVAYPKNCCDGQLPCRISQAYPKFRGCVKHTYANSERQPLGEHKGTEGRHHKKSQFKPSRVGEIIYTQSVPTPLDQGKLNPVFVEYMMGLPKGWVTDMDILRSQKLKMLGNGVVPQQAYYALQLLLQLDTPSEQDLC